MEPYVGYPLFENPYSTNTAMRFSRIHTSLDSDIRLVVFGAWKGGTVIRDS
jgi:hypothetical protein